jgi:hypothetical protein
VIATGRHFMEAGFDSPTSRGARNVSVVYLPGHADGGKQQAPFDAMAHVLAESVERALTTSRSRWSTTQRAAPVAPAALTPRLVRQLAGPWGTSGELLKG